MKINMSSKPKEDNGENSEHYENNIIEWKEERWIEAEGIEKDYDGSTPICAIGASSNEEENEEDEEDFGINKLFADPDPTDVFVETFQIASATQNSPKHSLKDVEEKKEVTATITLQGVKSENGQLLNSTGLTLWNASHLLCRFLASHPFLMEGKEVIELGAGLGLCGILAHKIGAKCVIMTDGDTDVLDKLRNNVQFNVGCSNIISLSTDGKLLSSSSRKSVVAVSQLLWGRHVTLFKSKWCNMLLSSSYNNTTTENSDHDGFDIIMGSDIIYAEEILEPLFDTIVELMKKGKASPSLFLLAYTRRNVSIDLVLRCAERHDLCWIVDPSAIKDDDGVEKKDEGVFVFRNRNAEVTDENVISLFKQRKMTKRLACDDFYF